MTALDVADLVVIGGRVLGIGTGAALEQVDPQAAEAALAEAPVPLSLPDSYAAAAACARLMSGLLQHPPFPEHRERVAVAVGLQFLAVNGWQADLDPPQAAALVVECLASGRIEPDDMAGWLAARLSAPAARGIRMPHIRNKESLVRLPLHGPARRTRSGAGMSVDGRMLVRFSDHAAAAIFIPSSELEKGPGSPRCPRRSRRAPPTSAPRTFCSPSTTTTGPHPGRSPGLGPPRTGSATPSRLRAQTRKGA